jgi:hypothetical protein
MCNQEIPLVKNTLSGRGKILHALYLCCQYDSLKKKLAPTTSLFLLYQSHHSLAPPCAFGESESFIL